MAQYIGQLLVTINGVSQVELTNAQVSVDGRKIPINTKKGLSGFALGARNIKITFETAIPIAGPEFDYITACYENQDYTVQVPFGAKGVNSVGQFNTATLGSSVDDAAKMGSEFMGTFPKPK